MLFRSCFRCCTVYTLSRRILEHDLTRLFCGSFSSNPPETGDFPKKEIALSLSNEPCVDSSASNGSVTTFAEEFSEKNETYCRLVANLRNPIVHPTTFTLLQNANTKNTCAHTKDGTARNTLELHMNRLSFTSQFFVKDELGKSHASSLEKSNENELHEDSKVLCLAVIRFPPLTKSGKQNIDELHAIAYTIALRIFFPERYETAVLEHPEVADLNIWDPFLHGMHLFSKGYFYTLQSLVRMLQPQVVEEVIPPRNGKGKFSIIIPPHPAFCAENSCPLFSGVELYAQVLKLADTQAYVAWKHFLSAAQDLTLSPSLNAVAVVTLAARKFFNAEILIVSTGSQREQVCTLYLGTDMTGVQIEIGKCTSTTKKDAIKLASLGALQSYFPLLYERTKKLSWYVNPQQKSITKDEETSQATPPERTLLPDLEFLFRTSSSRIGLRCIERTIRLSLLKLHCVELWSVINGKCVSCVSRYIGRSKTIMISDGCLALCKKHFPEEYTRFLTKAETLKQSAALKKTPKKMIGKDFDWSSTSTLSIFREAVYRASRLNAKPISEHVAFSRASKKYEIRLETPDNHTLYRQTSYFHPLRAFLDAFKYVLSETEFCKELNVLGIHAFHKIRDYTNAQLDYTLESACQKLLRCEYGVALDVSSRSKGDSDVEWEATASIATIPEFDRMQIKIPLEPREITYVSGYLTKQDAIRAACTQVIAALLPEIFPIVEPLMEDPPDILLKRQECTDEHTRSIEQSTSDQGPMQQHLPIAQNTTQMSIIPLHSCCSFGYMRIAIRFALGYLPREEIAWDPSCQMYTVILLDRKGEVLSETKCISKIYGVYQVYDKLLSDSRSMGKSQELYTRILEGHPYDPSNRLLPEVLLEYGMKYRYGLQVEFGTAITIVNHQNQQWTTSLQCRTSPEQVLFLCSATCATKLNSIRAASMRAMEIHIPEIYEFHSLPLNQWKVQRIPDIVSVFDTEYGEMCLRERMKMSTSQENEVEAGPHQASKRTTPDVSMKEAASKLLPDEVNKTSLQDPWVVAFNCVKNTLKAEKQATARMEILEGSNLKDPVVVRILGTRFDALSTDQNSETEYCSVARPGADFARLLACHTFLLQQFPKIHADLLAAHPRIFDVLQL